MGHGGCKYLSPPYHPTPYTPTPHASRSPSLGWASGLQQSLTLLKAACRELTAATAQVGILELMDEAGEPALPALMRD